MREMGSRELSEWIAYSELEPFSEDRADLRAGIIASTVANTAYARPKDPTAPKDFMPDFTGDRAEREAEEAEAKHIDAMRQGFEALRVRMGGKHIHRGRVIND